jgi:hypothetical protein
VNIKAIAGMAGKWISRAYSESDGSPSSSRIAITAVILFASGWITGLLHQIVGPVTLQDVSAFVEKLGGYVFETVTALYGLNCAREVMLKKFGCGDVAPEATQNQS